MTAPNSVTADEARLERYWNACEARVGAFVQQHYRWPGVYHLHRRALGLDLLKAPANVLLAVPALLVQVAGMTLRRLGGSGVGRLLLRVPLGFKTTVEQDLEAKLRQDLLDTPELKAQWPLGPEAGAAASKLISRYAETRRAIADLTTALLIGFLGIVLFDRFTPGSLSAGQELAANVTHFSAVRDFFLGPQMGRWFYHFFPPDTAVWAQILATVLVAAFASIIAAFSGLLADPLQALSGLHQWRLRRWFRACRKLTSSADEDIYRPWDPYMARIVDVVDAIKGLHP